MHLVDAGALRPDGSRFANDVAVDPDGNAYLTDSYSPIIYKIDLDGKAEVLLEDDSFTGEGFNLNGIDYHPDGFLLAVTLNTGRLLKVPLDSPADFSDVKLEGALIGADGVNLTANGDLVISVGTFGGEANRMVLLTSDDNWVSASIISTVVPESLITTATLRDSGVYVIHGHLDVLFSGDDSRQTFEIVRLLDL